MIGRLKGIIDEYGDDHVIIDVGGVGYHVACSTKTLAALPSKGEAGVIHTEMLVSENSIRLVGFATEAERGWFRLLDNVQGVGTKVALAILSTLDANELTNAIALGDKAMVGRANGVGPKLGPTHRDRTEGQGTGVHRGGPGACQRVRRAGRSPAHGRCGSSVSAGQPRLRPVAGWCGGVSRHARGGRGRRHRNADPPGTEGTGAVTSLCNALFLTIFQK
jgi:Holliday junction DNA helicase RuvA